LPSPRRLILIDDRDEKRDAPGIPLADALAGLVEETRWHTECMTPRCQAFVALLIWRTARSDRAVRRFLHLLVEELGL
jgi:hypothetical protein